MKAQRPAPITRVLAATDFSPGAAAALERAARLPLAPGAVLQVVHVMPAALPRKLRGQAEPEAQRLLERAAALASAAARRAGNHTLEVGSTLVRGQGYVDIIRQARSRAAELIVIGRHGRRPFRDLFLGSTAERVVRMSGSPVLVVNTSATRAYRRPLVAIELADTAPEIVELGLRLVAPDTRVCWLVHAYHIPFEGRMTYSLSTESMARYRKEWRDDAAKGMRRLVTELGDRGVRWKKVLRAGNPEAVILSEVARCRADLVAVGTHARSGIGHALLGSTAAWVLRNVPSDVVVARPAGFTFEQP